MVLMPFTIPEHGPLLLDGSMKRSARHRADVRVRVREAMIRNPLISLRSLCREVKGTEGTVGAAYYRFKQGRL